VLHIHILIPVLQPLHIAALRGHTEAIQAILDAGLSPSARSSRGWTPLDEACAGRSMAAARLLQRALLAEVKGEMKAKRAQLLDTMRSMPDYSLQVRVVACTLPQKWGAAAVHVLVVGWGGVHTGA
jgi:hypothetical protein